MTSQTVLSFDGDDFIEVADPFVNTTTFTISLWVRPSNLTAGWTGFIGKNGDAKRKPGMWMKRGPKALSWDSYAPADAGFERFYKVTDGGFLEMDQWVHVAWVKSGRRYETYRNGVLHSTDPAPEHFFTTDSPYWIGRVDNFWHGQISEVRIWKTARSSSQIRADRSRRLSGRELGLAAYWPLDEAEGEVAHDRSGNGNHGTIHGATWTQMETPLSSATRATGLDDFGYWWRWKQSLSAPADQPFRRGRIWC